MEWAAGGGGGGMWMRLHVCSYMQARGKRSLFPPVSALSPPKKILNPICSRPECNLPVYVSFLVFSNLFVGENMLML